MPSARETPEDDGTKAILEIGAEGISYLWARVGSREALKKYEKSHRILEGGVTKTVRNSCTASPDDFESLRVRGTLTSL